jgi:FKBP-type peptidyl-prolyl cis-trans isomerase FkpA
MKITKLFLAVILVVLLNACSNSEKETPSGLKYTVIKKGEGEVVPKGKYLMLNMLYKDNSDSVWIDTNERGMPMMIYKEDSVWTKNDSSIQEIFIDLRKGDSISFDVSAKDLFSKTWKSPIPENIKPETIISFFIGVQDVLTTEELNEWQKNMQAKQMIEMQAAAVGQKEIDKELIEKYLLENNIEANTTESGLKYVVTTEGSGEKPTTGQTISVNYAGYVLNGEYFDTSIKSIAEEKGLYNPQREPYEPIQFPLGQGAVIKGWDEGLALLNKGAKATFYIPSGLAYGARARSEKIPANAILVFDVELVDISE